MSELSPIYIPLLTMLGTLIVVSLGVMINNSRLGDIKSLIEARFNAMQSIMDARFAEQKAELLRVEQVMDARLKHIEESH